MAMEITTHGPVRVGLLTWQSQPSLHALTVACKMTFLLAPGQTTPVEHPDPINEEDEHWDDDPARSIFSPSDLAPFKARCDVVVVGSAFAPEQKPARMIVAQLVVGEIDKAIEVWCDRAFTLEGQLREGRLILRGPLRYERAAGGPDTTNPVGIAHDGPRDPHGMHIVPNIQPLGTMVAKPGDVVPSVGLGPIAPGWPERIGKLGRLAGRFPAPGWTERPLPEGLDASYFNVAPHDQQLRELHRNERLVLVNLHPQHARLVTSLSGMQPVVILQRAGGSPEGVGMRADTLWIDTDRGVCTVTWRGHAWLRSPREAGRVIVRVAGAEDSAAARSLKVAVADPTETLMPSPLVSVGAPLPFAAAAPGESPLSRSRVPSAEEVQDAEEISMDGAEDASGSIPPTLFLAPEAKAPAPPALPFGKAKPADATVMVFPEAAALAPGAPASNPAAAPPAVPRPPASRPASRAAPGVVAPVVAPVVAAGGAVASPPGVPAPPARHVPPLPVLAPPLTAPPVPPPLVEPRREPGAPIGPAIADSPWGGVSRDAPKAMTVGEAAAASAQAEKERFRAQASGSSNSAPVPPPPAVVAPPEAVKDAARGGAAGASDAAAQAAQQPADRPVFSFRPALELVWHNPGSLARIRKVDAWKKIVADLKPRPEEDDLDDDVPPPRRVPPKDRRELLAILSRGEPMDAEGVELALRRAIEDEAGFLPPLVLAAGELELQLDELEALKATIAAVSPHLGASEALRKTVENIQDVFKTPFVQGANTVLVDLARRLREAFAPVQKGLPGYDLEAHVQATLVDHRHYQKRTAFGQPRIRALFTTPGTRAVVPAYLPDSLAKELPGFRRMRVRMIAEVRPRAEEGDAGPAALRVLAVGREVT